MEILFEKLFEMFSLEYMFSVIIASYLVIKVTDMINGNKAVPTWVKRTITFIVGGVLFYVFRMYTETSMQSLIASFFSAIFVYDSAIKVIIRKFNIDYRK